ncbi:MAG: hypothetical protein NC293_12590 [Roseburia sp.]|nr:hypothetical protein [Roseburia sp.]
MKEIISYEKNDISKEIQKLQFEDKVNEELIEEFEAMEQTDEVKEALKECYAEREKLTKLTIKLCWT